jgi:hypothetical protein
MLNDKPQSNEDTKIKVSSLTIGMMEYWNTSILGFEKIER